MANLFALFLLALEAFAVDLYFAGILAVDVVVTLQCHQIWGVRDWTTLWGWHPDRYGCTSEWDSVLPVDVESAYLKVVIKHCFSWINNNSL